eukprot:scaffold40990_cov31-Phaeocystis_antarctica.AAC.1
MVMPSVLAPKLPVEFMSMEFVSISLVWSASKGCHTRGLSLHLQPAFIEPKSEGNEHSSLIFEGVRMMPALLKVAGCLTLMIDADHHCANCLQAPASHGLHGCVYSSVPSKQCTVRPASLRSLLGVPCRKRWRNESRDHPGPPTLPSPPWPPLRLPPRPRHLPPRRWRPPSLRHHGKRP